MSALTGLELSFYHIALLHFFPSLNECPSVAQK